MKRGWTTALILMGIVTLMLVAGAGYLFWRNTFQNTANKDEALKVYVQVQPLAVLGEDVRLTLTVENEGDDFVGVEEIRLPAALTDASVINGVFPSMHPGEQHFYGESTGYTIDLMLEPGERREFVIQLMPWQIADVANEIDIQTTNGTLPASFRVLFNKPVVEALPPTVAPTRIPTLTAAPTSTLAPTPTMRVTIPFEVVVKIIAKVKYSSYLRDIWGGSGTVVSEDGLILTNAHLVVPVQGASPDVFVIAMTANPAEPPVEMYYAEPILTDKDLDLAVMRITSDLNYRPVDWQTTRLNAAVLGDSDQLQLGDPLTILGYPGIGGETITLTSGNVGGFTAQRDYGDHAYIKTSATISGGTSGGIVLNEQGQMVAIPTQLGSGEEENVVDCRVITDTNGDGNVNELDACVPVGGFINALRPINLAIEMIETARRMPGSQ